MAKTKRQESKALTAAAEKREPNDAERASIAKAAQWRLDARAKIGEPPRVETYSAEGQRHVVGPRHNDVTGHMLQTQRALGTTSPEFCDLLLTQMMAGSGVGLESGCDAKVNAAMAVLHGAQPGNEVEAMLVGSAFTFQETASKCLTLAHGATRRDQMADYINMANKSARTMGALLETFAKLRSGGKQQVEVRYVYVDARTQTVVGGGGDPRNLAQPHGAAGIASLPFAPGAPVWSQDEARDALPVASGEEPAAVSDTRVREGRRRSDGDG